MNALPANDLTSDELDTIPQSQDAETALLGILLYDNESYHRISSIVQAKHFYNPIHVKIFDTISRMISSGHVADGITVKQKFMSDDTLKEIGGVDYIALILDKAAPTSTARDYAKLVLDLAMRRELVRFGDGVVETAKNFDSDASADEQISDAESVLFQLGQTGAIRRGPVNFAETLSETIEMVSSAYARDGMLAGISTGYPEINKKLGGLANGRLVILAGRPAMGKSSLALNIAFNIASAFEVDRANPKGPAKSGGRVLFASLEMSNEEIGVRLLAEGSRVFSSKLTSGNLTRDEYERVRDVAAQVEQAPLFIDDQGALSIERLGTRARRLKRMEGLDCIVIDYLQLLTVDRLRSGANRTVEVSTITAALKALAKDLEVPILALAQLSRKVEERDNKRPIMPDLRESGSIEQDADQVMFVYRPEYYHAQNEPDPESHDWNEWNAEAERLKGKAEVIVGKNRHGSTGIIPIGFEAAFTTFISEATA